MGVIIISGDVGSGTTSLRRGLVEHFSWEGRSTGDYFRSYSKEHGFPLWDKSKFPDDFELDVDRQMVAQAATAKNAVLEGHYLGWLTREDIRVFRILCTLDPKTAEERAFARDGEEASDVQRRRMGHREKFVHLYGKGDYLDPRWFHLIIDTKVHDKAEVVRIAIDAFHDFSRL